MDGLGIELRKFAIRAPTQSTTAEGHMTSSVSAGGWSALRSQRPQARPQIPCTRTGRPRDWLRAAKASEQSGGWRLRPHDLRVRSRGVGLRRNTDEVAEQSASRHDDSAAEVMGGRAGTKQKCE